MTKSWRDYIRLVLGFALPVSWSVGPSHGAAPADGQIDRSIGAGRTHGIEPLTFQTPLRIDGPDQMARHGSHRSHSSHSSHRSHVSGYGGYTTTPAPPSAPPYTAPPPYPATPGSPTGGGTGQPQQFTAPGGTNTAPGAPKGAPGAGGGTATQQGLIVAMRAQVELKRLGYYNGTIDGIVGPGTMNAIRRFQIAQGLGPSAVLDNATLARLGISY